MQSQYTPNGGVFSQQRPPYQQPPQQQQPMNPQQQQQQHQMNGNMSNSGASTSAGDAASSGQAQPEMNLANVLHYLQSEWRRWERDRNEWEIERAEMRARIALLEGERRSAENLKVDLMRRVKMLEFALRQERSKTLTSSPPAGIHGGIAPARFAALQEEDKASSGGDKESSGSEGSDEETRSNKANGVNHSAPSALGSAAKRPATAETNVTSPKQALSAPAGIMAWKSSSGSVAGRDPKSRARSREYLKQCLQEVTYLTSPGALNPLPPKPLINFAPVGDGHDSAEAIDVPPRPKKVLPVVEPEAASKQPVEESESSKAGAEDAKAQDAKVTERPPSSDEVSPAARSMTEDSKAGPSQAKTETPQVEAQESASEREVLTAIYKPESKAAWREELRAANELAEKAHAERTPSLSSTSMDDFSSATATDSELGNIGLVIDDEEASGATKTEDVVPGRNKLWKSRRSLRSHLDAVRSLAFYHGPELMLVSGGDDCTVKVWTVDAATVLTNKHATLPELEPTITLRGHTAPVTSLCVSSSRRTIFSASLDSTVRLWTLPHGNHDPYAPQDQNPASTLLVGHTDAVWGVCLLPAKSEARDEQETVLVSIGAEGAIKVWEADSATPAKWELRTSFDYYGTDSPEEKLDPTLPIPTCLAVYQSDFTKVLVGFSNSVVKAFDVRTGAASLTLSHGEGGSVETQVNCVLSHPTLPIVLAGTEDGYLHTFDSITGTLSHSLLAHPDAVTSLELNHTSPMTVITSSADCTCRIWDLSSKTSIQELAGHRERANEGVLDIASHPVLPVLGTAGADGVVRVWSAMA